MDCASELSFQLRFLSVLLTDKLTTDSDPAAADLIRADPERTLAHCTQAGSGAAAASAALPDRPSYSKSGPGRHRPGRPGDSGGPGIASGPWPCCGPGPVIIPSRVGRLAGGSGPGTRQSETYCGRNHCPAPKGSEFATVINAVVDTGRLLRVKHQRVFVKASFATKKLLIMDAYESTYLRCQKFVDAGRPLEHRDVTGASEFTSVIAFIVIHLLSRARGGGLYHQVCPLLHEPARFINLKARPEQFRAASFLWPSIYGLKMNPSVRVPNT